MKQSHKPQLWLRLFNSFVLLAIIVSVFSCKKTDADITEPVSQAIDMFYFENYNDSVLALLDYPAFLNSPSSSNKDLKIIFSAAALNEKGFSDSARTLLNTVATPIKNAKINYYYQSIDGQIDYRQNNFDSSYEKFLLVNTLEVQDVRALALNERMIGRIMKLFTDYKSSINWFLLSKQHFEEAGLEKSAAITNKFLGSSCIKSHLFNEATEYLLDAKDTFKKFQDKDELFYVYIVLIDLYVQQHKLDSATMYVQQASEELNLRNDKRMLSNVYNNLGEIELMRKNFPKSLEMFQKTLDLGDNYYSAPQKQQFAHYCRGKIYNMLGQTENANDELQKALVLLGNSQDGLKFEVYKEIAKVNSTKNTLVTNAMIDSTVFFAKKYYNSQSVNIVNSLMTQSELEIVKNNVNNMIQQRKKAITYTIIGLIVLLGIIFILLRSWRIKNENNKMLHEMAQKNLRLLQEERKLKKAIQDSNICLKSNKKTPTDEERSRLIFSDLIDWLEKDQNYMRNDLNLDIVSKEIGTNRDYLSRAINDQEIRFPDLINKYRINEAISILSDKDDKRSRFNLQVIASEIGFNSYSVFVDAFRKQTSMTPVQFRDRVFHVEN